MSKQAKHSPGPWVVAEEHPDGIIDRCVKSADDYFVATVHDTTHGTWDDDARLIAAAPDLLAALKQALTDSGCDGDLCGYQWHVQAREAIAKAEDHP